MTRLIVGLDFSTAWADASLMTTVSADEVAHQRFDNSVSGLHGLKQLVMTTLAAADYDGVDIAGEATGMYWLPFFLALAADPELTAHDAHLSILNPRWVTWHKRTASEVDKTDANDAWAIADHIRVHPPQVTWQPDPQALALRSYTRYRFHLIKTLAAEKSYFCAYLFLKANAYQRLAPFSNVFGATSRLVLDQAVTLDALAELPVADLATLLADLSHGSLPDPYRNATQLQQVAVESFPLPAPLALPVHQILSASLQHIAFMEAQIAQVNGWIDQQLAHFPAIRQLQTIPGIGPVLSAGIGAEIVPLARFLQGTKRVRGGRERPRNLRDAENAIAKIAGLWWPSSESGSFAAADRRMSKSGNAYLRYYLIQAADQLRTWEPKHRRYYQRKHREAYKHHHKRALVLTARKSLGLIVGLLHRNEPYRSKEAPDT